MNVIPGETTAGPVFLGMGAGYLVLGTLVFLRVALFDPIAFFYTLGLVLAYAATRDRLPVEPIGLTIKAIEGGLLIAVIGVLIENRRGGGAPPPKR